MCKSKRIFLPLLVIAFLILFSLNVRAEDTSREYIVGTSGGEYTLYAGDGETLLATKPTLSELISSLTEPDGLSFRDVVTDEGIELPRGSYALGGSLTVLSDGIITVPTGTEVTVNATVKFGDGVTASGGYMRIKGGSVTLDGGSVFAGEGVGF